MTPALETARALAVVAFLACGWVALGSWIIRRVRRELAPGERLALAVVAGAGAEGVALVTVGLLRFTPLVVSAATLAALAPLARSDERAALRDTMRALQRPPLLVLVPLLVLGGAMLLQGLAHPIGGMGHDGISYHLGGPAFWLRNGRVLPSPDFSLTAFPVAVEALFGAGMALGGDRAPGAIGTVLAWALLGQTVGLARWLGASTRWAIVASLVVATMPAAVQYAPVSFVDVEYAAFALAAFRLLFDEETELSWLGPLFLGLATATKYNGLTLVPLTLALAGARLVRRRGLVVALRFSAAAAVIAMVPVLPVLIRNFLMLGNPIYPPPPALARLLPARGFSYEASLAMQRYVHDERGAGLGRGLGDLALLPWRYTMKTSSFHGAGGIGLAPLAFFPAALLATWGPRVRWAVAWIAMNALVWFAVQQEARFLIPFVVLAAALSVSGAELLVARYPKAGRAAVAVTLAASFGYGGILMIQGPRGSLRSLVSASADATRTRAAPYHEAYAFLNALPGPCRVLILGKGMPPYFLERPYVKPDGLYGEHPIAGVETPAAALARVHELGITHVLDGRSSSTGADPAYVPEPPPPDLGLVLETTDARVFAVRDPRP